MAKYATAFGLLVLLIPGYAQETLYNGIQLPAQWPPILPISQLPSTPTYLLNPPAVIPIDRGRQLFVDDFLIDSTTLQRTPHRPVFYGRNPILAPGEWPDPTYWAFPYSDGVWFDPADNLYKMWYLGAHGAAISYAYSTDGIHWTRPSLSLVPGTNRVLDLGGGRDSVTVWMDLEDPDPARKFKAFVYAAGARLNWYTSPDGISWTKQANRILTMNDRTTFFWNPFRQVWINNIRHQVTVPAGLSRPSQQQTRARFYAESTDLVNFNPADPRTAFWLVADENDPSYYPGGQPPQLYNLDAVAYESVMLGLFSFLHPGPEEQAGFLPAPNLVEMGVGFSRDGFQWERPTRGFGATAFIPAANTPGAWDAYNTQSVGGTVLVVGDQLRFYFSGRSLQHYQPWGITPSATGLAILRRDGFYSMDAGTSEGVLTTRPVRFNGHRLFVNVKNPGGELRAELLDASGQVIAPFTKANSIPVTQDKTLFEMRWQGVNDLSALAGTAVKIRFYLTNGELYSFWVTPSADGASYGYVGAGGPGFTGPIDTVGRLGGSGEIDIEPPSAAMTFPTPDSNMTGSVTLTANVADNVGVTAVQFKIDGANFGPELNAPPFQVALDATTLSQGPHQFSVTASDAELNSSTSTPVTANVVFGEPPVLSNGQPSGALPAGTTQTLIQFNTNEAATCRWSASPGVPFPSMTSTFPSAGGLAHSLPVTGLTPNSSHSYYVRCVDTSGNYNLTDYIVQFSVAPDTEAPAVTIQSPTMGQTLLGSIQISATATDNVGVAGVTFSVDGTPLGVEDTVAPYAATWNTSSYPNGPHQVGALARDAAGNIRAVSTMVTVLNTVVDSIPPALSNGAPGGTLPAGTRNAQLTLTTDENATCRYATSSGAAFSAMTVFQNTGGVFHSTPLSNLADGTTYSFYTRCQDLLLNTSAADYAISFSIGSPAPVYSQVVEAEAGGPVSPMRAVSDNGFQYIRTVQTNTGTATYRLTLPFATTLRILGRVWAPRASYGSFYVSVDGADEQLWDLAQQISAGGVWQWLPVKDASGVREFELPAGTHFFTFRGGAVNTYLDTLVFTSDPSMPTPPPSPADTTPPVISNPLPVGALPAGSSETVLSLNTNEFATCRYSSNPARPFDAMENVFTTTGGVTHSVTLDGLADGATYEYMVRCQDAAANANTQSFQVYFSVAVPGQSSSLYQQYFEAESGNLVSPMFVTFSDSSTSGSKFIRSSSNELGTATYILTVPTPGSYVIWGRLQMLAGVPSRFHVSVDGGPEDVLTGPALTPWSWRQIVLPTGGPKLYDLTAGSHTIVVRSGTGNSYLDRLFLSNDPYLDPGGSAALVASNGAPSGALASGTTQTAMTVSTNRPATCRYATTAGLSYSAMPSVFSTTGNVSHSSVLTGLAAGVAYAYYVRCNDGASDSQELAIQFTVTDGQSPQVTLTSPANNQSVSGQVAVAATASDDVAVAGVSFYLNGNPLGPEDTQAPYGQNWDTAASANGSHILSAVARDSAGNTETTSVSVVVANIAIDAIPPALSGGAPAGVLPAGTMQALLTLSTDEPAMCRYSTASGTAYPAMTSPFTATGGTSHVTQLSGLGEGSYTFFVRCQDVALNANTSDYPISFSIASAPAEGISFEQYVEAETGVLVLPMTALAWNTASGGIYVRSNTVNQGSVSLSITVPSDGDYVLWGRILSGTSNFDSFWVSVDGGPEDLWDTAEGLWKNSWQWTRVTGRNTNGGLPSLGNTTPRVFSLSAGTHIIRFGGAENYTYLDRIFITNSQTSIPQ